jgi:hypothetical protein
VARTWPTAIATGHDHDHDLSRLSRDYDGARAFDWGLSLILVPGEVA